jgi:hypothetical protein
MKSIVDTQLLNLLHTHQQHTAAMYIFHSLCHVTQMNISKHFVLPATASHTATLETKLTVHTECLFSPNMELQESPFNGSRYTADKLEELTNLLTDMLTDSSSK